MMTSPVIVHLNEDGGIRAIQRQKEPQYIRKEFPAWVQEKVAFLRIMTNLPKEEQLNTLQAYMVNPVYIVLYPTKAQHRELGKLIGT